MSPFLPTHVFISTDMMHLVGGTDDEVAMILAHEMAHSLRGHGISTLRFTEGMARSLSLSIGPVFYSLHDFGVHNISLPAFKRRHEVEADALGLRLTAMACFRTNVAARAIRRLKWTPRSWWEGVTATTTGTAVRM